MFKKKISRRECLNKLEAGAVLAASATTIGCTPKQKQTQQPSPESSKNKKEELTPPLNHDRRIQWWREAKFGMFIHWGLYSVLGRHEWAMEVEGIPISEYQELAK